MTLFHDILFALIDKKNIEFNVLGDSMYPVLMPGDIIEVKKEQKYSLGDIIVFLYKNEGIIVHRLLRIKNHILYLKGDNSFRLEDISIDNVIGKVISVNRCGVKFTPQRISNEQLNMSLKINDEFHKNHYNKIETMKTSIYKEYNEKYLKGSCL